MAQPKEVLKETPKQKEILSGDKVLEKVFERLENKLFGRTLKFPQDEEAKTETYYDNDPHGSTTDYMIYQSIFLAEIDRRVWAIGLGEDSRKLVARHSSRDIIALPIEIDGKTDEQLTKELAERIKNDASFFKASLILTRMNGQGADRRLAVSQRSSFYPDLLLSLPEKAEEIIAGDVDSDSPARLRGGKKIEPVPQSFSPEIIENLEKAIIKTLFYQGNIQSRGI